MLPDYPLLQQPLILPPQFLGSVNYYAAMTRYANVVIDCSMRYNKRFKSTHRTTICGANNIETITVPIVKPTDSKSATWADVLISDHNQWWGEAFNALQSAYGRTPYFEFYADDFQAFFTESVVGMPLMQLDMQLDTLLRRLLMIDARVSYEMPENLEYVDDYRERAIRFTTDIPYYQIRTERHGFMPGLSVVDMLFNIGPESAIHLRQMGILDLGIFG